MAYQATVYRIMIASPGDVQDERLLFRDVIIEWNAVNSEEKGIVLLPISWETHSSPGIGRPQGIISEQVLRNADLLVAAFWTRIGTPTGKAASGTVEELNDHIQAGKQAMLYFSNAPVQPDQINHRQFKAVDKLRKQYLKTSLFCAYNDLESLRSSFTRHLALAIQKNFASVAVVEDIPAEFIKPDVSNSLTKALKDSPDISPSSKELLNNIARDKSCELMVTNTKSGFSASTNGKELADRNNAIDEIRIRSAIDQLLNAGLLRDKSNGKGQIYSLTESGLNLAEILLMAKYSGQKQL